MNRQLGKQAILDAAAILMDERGVDNVTTQDINQASGHRNRSAVQVPLRLAGRGESRP